MVTQGMELMGAASVLFPKLNMPDVLLANGVVMVLGARNTGAQIHLLTENMCPAAQAFSYSWPSTSE